MFTQACLSLHYSPVPHSRVLAKIKSLPRGIKALREHDRATEVLVNLYLTTGA